MSSFTECTGSEGYTTRTLPDVTSSVTGARSLAGSNGSFGYITRLVATGTPPTRIVWPSASERTTASMPMLVPAPGRFSTSTGWPRPSDSGADSARARMSTVPPAAAGTTRRTGFDGKPCANASVVKRTSVAAISFRMAPLYRIDRQHGRSGHLREAELRPPHRLRAQHRPARRRLHRGLQRSRALRRRKYPGRHRPHGAVAGVFSRAPAADRLHPGG